MTTTRSMAGAPPTDTARAGVDAGFEQRIIEATEPISGYYLAAALHHLFATGLYDELAAAGDRPVPVPRLAGSLGMDASRLRGFLRFLANNGVTVLTDDAVLLTERGRQYGEARGWYTMMVGGYGITLLSLGEALTADSPPIYAREGLYVGQGSCEVSRYDGLPITRSLLDRAGVSCSEVLDLGCGDAVYLVELCRHFDGVKAWGAEPNRDGYLAAVERVGREGLADRIQLRNSSAGEFLADPPDGCQPDVIVFGFVLHEILAQDGVAAVRQLLRSVIASFPRINIVVIEVPDLMDDPRLMRHGLAHNFWNPYFLLHVFTAQQLERQAFWEDLFASAQLQVVDLITTDPVVDSTGLELGYLLRAADPRDGLDR